MKICLIICEKDVFKYVKTLHRYFCSENWIHERWTNEFIINNYVVIDITNQERMNLFEID